MIYSIGEGVAEAELTLANGAGPVVAPLVVCLGDSGAVSFVIINPVVRAR
jgi:hypothetical protein